MLPSDLVSHLAIPGLPEWSGLVVLLVILLAAISFGLMPFSVFGVKGRLEGIEAQLDEIQDELRALASRLPDSVPRRLAPQEGWEDPPSMQPLAARDPRPLRQVPPVPPPPELPARGTRQEPRFR